MRAQAKVAEAWLAWAAAWAALLPLNTLLENGAWVMPAVIISAAAVIAGIVVRAYVRNAFAVISVQLLVGIEAAVLWHGRGHTFFGLPRWDTVIAFNNILIQARETLMQYAAPAPTNRGMILALSLIALLVVLVVDLLAVTLRAPAAAGLPLLTAFLLTTANRGEPLPFGYFVLSATLWLVLLARTGTLGLRRWATVLPRSPDGQQSTGDPRTGFVQMAGRLGVAVIAAAVVVPVLIPQLPTRYLTDGLGRSDNSVGGGSFTLSTTLDLRANLGSQSTSPALKYRTSLAAPGPLRVAVLTDYRDGEFRARPLYPARPIRATIPLQMVTTLNDWWQPLREKLPSDSRRDEIFTAYSSDLNRPQIAMPYGARYLRTENDVQAVEYGDGSVEVLDRAPSYEVDFTQVALTPEILQEARPWDSTESVDPQSVTEETVVVDEAARPILDATLAEIAGDAHTDLEKAVAIQDWLRSSEFTYSLDLAPVTPIDGVEPDPVTHFLLTKQGFCQQFATAMIMLARSSGIPARMAIGFLPGTNDRGEWTVRRSDAHAWPELYFSNVGWVRFDPTPGSRAGAAPAYARVPVESTASTTRSSSTSSSSVARPERPLDNLDPQGPTLTSRSLWQRIQDLPMTAWLALALVLGILAALVVPVTSLLARRRRFASREDEADLVEARWQDLISRVADLGIATPVTLTPRQVQTHLTDQAVLDRDTAAALGRVVDVVEVARYAPPGTAIPDPAADIETIYDSVETSRPPRVRVRARLLPYAGRSGLRSAYGRVTGLPARLLAEMRARRDS